jgi:hypothetical protein
MDWDPIRTSSAAKLSLVAAQSDDESGSVAEFVIDLAARYRDGAPLRVDSQLADFLTVDRTEDSRGTRLSLDRRHRGRDRWNRRHGHAVGAEGRRDVSRQRHKDVLMMTNRPRVGRPDRGRQQERGAALVEFALIVTMFLVLIFGTIEFGLDYNDYIAVRNGSREAARMGVVNDVSGAPACSINGATVTPPANPTTATDATNALICKAKDRIGLKGSSTKIQIIAGVNPGDTLKVCASYPVGSITGLVAPFVAGKQLVSKVSMRLEQTPVYSSYSGEGTIC